jgi:hypothetical protein
LVGNPSLTKDNHVFQHEKGHDMKAMLGQTLLAVALVAALTLSNASHHLQETQ